MMNTYGISEFARMTGVSVKTLQRWDRQGKLKPALRSPGNRRLYTEEQVFAAARRGRPQKRLTVCYARVSSQSQKPALEKQRAVLEQFCVGKGIAIDEWLLEIGGGLNFKRPKFVHLIDRILLGEIATLVIAHQDRLTRFGYEFVLHLCEVNDCQIIVLNTESLSPEQELVQDLMTIVHGFSLRLDGLRNYRQQLKEALKS